MHLQRSASSIFLLHTVCRNRHYGTRAKLYWAHCSACPLSGRCLCPHCVALTEKMCACQHIGIQELALYMDVLLDGDLQLLLRATWYAASLQWTHIICNRCHSQRLIWCAVNRMLPIAIGRGNKRYVLRSLVWLWARTCGIIIVKRLTWPISMCVPQKTSTSDDQPEVN